MMIKGRGKSTLGCGDEFREFPVTTDRVIAQMQLIQAGAVIDERLGKDDRPLKLNRNITSHTDADVLGHHMYT